MSDRYLWDRGGEPDLEVVRLERLLSRYRFEGERRPVAGREDASSWRWLAACAAVIIFVSLAVAAALALRLRWEPERAWDVLTSSGSVAIDGQPIDSRAVLPPGGILETGTDSRATVRVARIGEITIGESSIVSLQYTGARRHRVSLEHGSLSARIWAPPFAFGVQTPAGLASDLGCEFTLQFVDGSGRIDVTSGWVDFDGRTRSSLIPAGATAELRQDNPGTPHYRDAGPAFINALRDYDESGDRESMRQVLATARHRDAMTLLHILERAPLELRPEIFYRTAQLASPPEGVTLDGVLQRHRRDGAVDLWRRSIGLGGYKRWWINWRDALPRSSREESG
ncbi:MAG TPA: FecR domain-containing protein [Thermoanaerobaculia bacterium]